jgi:predicted AAA+ superfamily ATPase
MMIQRYQQERFNFLVHHFPIVGILGSRQIGKTTLSKKVSTFTNKEVIYIDLESPADANKLLYAEDFFNLNSNKTIIIDEVQLQPSLFSILRPLVDKKKQIAQFILLGSVSPNIIKGASEALTGRIAYLYLSGLNLKEVPIEEQNALWLKGGYPEAFLTKSLTFNKEWLDSYIDNYIKRELPQLGLNTTNENIRRFWTMIAHNNGMLWNTSHYSKSLKLDNKTIDRYVDFMEGAFLLNRLLPFYSNGNKRLVKSSKIYMKDSGILHRLLRINNIEELYGTTHIGNSWEGFAFEQIKQLKNSDIDLYFYRTQHGAEVDLVFVRGQTPIATAEIKLSNAPEISRGNTQSIMDLGTRKNYVITPASDDYRLNENWHVCSLSTFIKEYLLDIK